MYLLLPGRTDIPGPCVKSVTARYVSYVGWDLIPFYVTEACLHLCRSKLQ